MRKFLYGLGLVAAIAILSVVAVTLGLPLPFGSFIQISATSCQHNDEIAADERANLDQAGLRFVQALLSADIESASAAMSAEAQGQISKDQLAALARKVAQMAPFNNLQVAQTYLIATTGAAPQVICGNLGKPEDRVIVASSRTPEQGYVIIDAEGRNNDWSFVLWLEHEQDWRVNYVYFNAVSVVGKSAQDFWTLARNEQGLGHAFNAALLYTTAAQLAYRGPNLQFGIQPDIQRELAAMEFPTLIRGQAPFIWTFGGKAYKVLQVAPLGVGGKIYLTITHEILPWSQDSEADNQNRELIRDFGRAVPEYSGVFAGLVVAAQEKGGSRGYRTVEPLHDQPM